MIRHLVNRMAGEASAATLFGADALDLGLYAAQVWDAFEQAASDPPGAQAARHALWSVGAFAAFAPDATPAWEHLGYSYALENSRVAQIFRRVVQEYRSGERLGIPSALTQRWADTTEALLDPIPSGLWASPGLARPAPESVRRNAYWRMFGMELAFGTDRNEPAAFDKAEASNTAFVSVFEALLRAVRRATARTGRAWLPSQRNHAVIQARVEDLRTLLLARRPFNLLAREELAAATVMGWLELSLRADSPVVKDLQVQADTAAARLKLIGERVGLAAHQKVEALFSLAPDLSFLLREIESISATEAASRLLLPDAPLAQAALSVSVHWREATGAAL